MVRWDLDRAQRRWEGCWGVARWSPLTVQVCDVPQAGMQEQHREDCRPWLASWIALVSMLGESRAQDRQEGPEAAVVKQDGRCSPC